MAPLFAKVANIISVVIMKILRRYFVLNTTYKVNICCLSYYKYFSYEYFKLTQFGVVFIV